MHEQHQVWPSNNNKTKRNKRKKRASKVDIGFASCVEPVTVIVSPAETDVAWPL